MFARRRLCLVGVVGLAALAAACGGGSPTAPPPPLPTYDVVAIVYYDENGNGALDPGEGARLGGVEVEIGGRTGRTERVTGRAVVSGVLAGSHTARVRPQSLPPFYAAGAPAPAVAPQPSGSDVLLGVTLPIGVNRPNTYMAFGDSITVGDGSSDDMGYRGLLQDQLQGDFGRGTVLDEGVEGSQTIQGAARIPGTLSSRRPAYTLVLYGTNDWNDSRCQHDIGCPTVDALRSIVRSVKGASSLPFLATIIPGNPAFPQVPPARNDWVHRTDEQIRTMAREEGAVLVDLEAAFLAQGDLTQLFSDHVHPNDAGYRIMADEFFKAISEPQASASGIFGPDLFALPPGAGPAPETSGAPAPARGGPPPRGPRGPRPRAERP